MTQQQIKDEIAALKRLALTCPEDTTAQASIAGQVNALEWTLCGDTQDEGCM